MMAGNVFSVFYLCVFIVAGHFCARVFFCGEKPLIRIWLGGIIALLMLLWLPALFAFFLDFGTLAQLLALLLCAGAGVCAFLLSRRKECARLRLKEDRSLLFALLPFVLLGAYLFHTHTIQPQNGGLHVGQSTFGDLPLHLGLVTSIGEQGYFPPEYSILPGVAVGYPFLCDSISATFYVLGASLRFSMILPALFAYCLVLFGVYFFFETWLATQKVALFATLLFFVGGGFGFAYFLDLVKIYPENFTRIFEAFYNTPTNYVDYGIKWVNPIADMLIPQRATLFGWALLFPALFMLHRAAFEKQPRWFVPLGILGGCMPLVHTHSFLALGVLSAVYLIRALFHGTDRKALQGWGLYAGLAVLLAAPQLLLFTFRQSAGFLQFHFNWANETDSFLWFYIKNWGLLFLLMPVAYFRLDKENRGFYNGALVLWALAEFIQFQPNAYDNNKLLFVWFAFTCGIVAKLLLELYAYMKDFSGRRFFAAATLVALFLSGVLTLGRECVSDYEQFSADEAAAAQYIKEHTLPDATFLTANNHNNAVAALTGRNIVCGTGSYLFFHGLDYATREAALRTLYEQPAEAFYLLREQYDIAYVWLGFAERYTYDCDMEFFSSLPLFYENNTVRIYAVNPGP